MVNKINVYSHDEFNDRCKANGYNDSNVEDMSDKAFISIVGTPECRTYYLEDETTHWFNDNHPNVINLQFDDLTSDRTWKGHTFKAMTQEQADLLFDFIIANLGKEFWIHCKAGASRSQGVARIIADLFKGYSDESLREDNPCLYPNQHVIRLLKNSLNTKLDNDYDNIIKVLKAH